MPKPPKYSHWHEINPTTGHHEFVIKESGEVLAACKTALAANKIINALNHYDNRRGEYGSTIQLSKKCRQCGRAYADHKQPTLRCPRGPMKIGGGYSWYQEAQTFKAY